MWKEILGWCMPRDRWLLAAFALVVAGAVATPILAQDATITRWTPPNRTNSLALPSTTERASVDSTNNPATVTPIAFGDTVSASIDLPSEMDTYTFVGASGDQVLVRVAETSGSLWPLIRVYRPNGTLLCEDYSPSTAEVFCTLTSSGMHTILVADYFGTYTGEYSLYLQRTNNPGNATPISFGDTLSGTVAAAEMDAYTFVGASGDQIIVRMSKTSGSLWPLILVYRPNGTLLCEDYSPSTAEVFCTLTSSGMHTILVADYFGTYTGEYSLYLQRTNNPGNATPISFGETLSGSIGAAAEMDTYTFTASAGDVVLVRMSRASVSLYAPDGTKLCSDLNGCSLPSDGTYTILAGGTGDYDLYLQRLNDPGNAIPIAFGDTVSASIDLPAEMDAYTFVGASGDQVLVRVAETSGSLWPLIRVYRPNGTLLCEDYSPSTAEVSCSLTSSGTHTILVGDYFGTYTGEYSLYLQRTNNPGNAIPIAFGNTLSGTVAAAEMDAYTFVGTPGDQVLVRVAETSGSLWPLIRVYPPNGTLLCEDYSPSTAEVFCTLTSSGMHTILVADYFGTYTGQYSLYLQRTNNPGNATPISFGETLSGSIGAAAEMDTYTFCGASGDQVLVRVAETSGSLWPLIRVYPPNGTLLCEDYSPSTAEVSCSLTSAGMHTILVGDYLGTYTGEYNVSLTCVAGWCSCGPVGDLTMQVNPSGSGTTIPPEGIHTYPDGSVVPLSASPNSGWEFTGWTGDPDCTDGSVTMNAKKTCIANFSPSFICGDVNCDSTVDAVDALFVLQYVVGLRQSSDQCPPPPGTLYLRAANVNCDGTVDAVDALFILQYVVGIRPELCVC